MLRRPRISRVSAEAVLKLGELSELGVVDDQTD